MIILKKMWEYTLRSKDQVLDLKVMSTKGDFMRIAKAMVSNMKEFLPGLPT